MHLGEGEDVEYMGPVEGDMGAAAVDEVLIGVVHHLAPGIT